MPAACRTRTRARARSTTTRRDRAAGAFGRDRSEACAAHVRIRGGNALGRSRCADATARERRARRDGRRRQGGGGAERARRRRSRARFLVGATRKGWREDFTLRFATSMACPVSLWTDPRDRCRLRRSRLRATSFGRCTWCAIRTSCGIWRQRRAARKQSRVEQAGADGVAAMCRARFGRAGNVLNRGAPISGSGGTPSAVCRADAAGCGSRPRITWAFTHTAGT